MGITSRSFWVVIFFVVRSISYTQEPAHCDCLIRGIVIDNHTKQPIAGAILHLKDSSKNIVTDSTGRYKFEGLCQGKYILECKIIGYKTTQTKISLVHKSEQNISLSEEEIHLADVEIKAQRIQQIALTQNTLQLAELDKTLGKTLGEALTSIIGVSMLQTGASIVKPVIQGMHSNRVLILNNGVRQEGQQWGSEHAPEIDPFIAKKLTVVKGATSVRYGSDAIGGVVLVEPAPLPYSQAMQGEAHAIYFTNGQAGTGSATIEGSLPKLKKIGWRVQGTLKNGGNISTPYYYLANTGVKEQNFSTSIGYRNIDKSIEVFYSRFSSNLGIFSGAHIGSLSDLLAVISQGEPFIKTDFRREIENPRQQISHNLVKIRGFQDFSGNKLSLTFARQYNHRAEYDLHSLQQSTSPSLLFRITTYTADALLEHKPLKQKITGQIGISGLYQFNFTDGRPLIPDFEQVNAGGFVIERLIKEKWEAEIGGRYDWRWLRVYRFINNQLAPQTHLFSNWSGSIGGVFKPQQALQVRANISTAWRPPTPNELYSMGVHHGAAAYEEGTAALRPEVAYHVTNSVVYARKRGKIEGEIYYKWIDNFIYLQPQSTPILTVRGAFPAFKYIQTDATFAGADITGQWLVTDKIEHQIKCSYLRAYDQSQNQFLVMIPPNRVENSLKINTGRKMPIEFGIKHLWMAQQKRVPPNSDFMPPPASYHLWSGYIQKEWKYTKKQQLKALIECQNVFNMAYRDYMNRFRYYALEQGRNIAIKVKYSFQS